MQADLPAPFVRPHWSGSNVSTVSCRPEECHMRVVSLNAALNCHVHHDTCNALRSCLYTEASKGTQTIC